MIKNYCRKCRSRRAGGEEKAEVEAETEEIFAKWPGIIIKESLILLKLEKKSYLMNSFKNTGNKGLKKLKPSKIQPASPNSSFTLFFKDLKLKNVFNCYDVKMKNLL